jgi:sucrose-phosphate synthase
MVGMDSQEQEHKPKPKHKLYLVLISIHGLIRGHDLELGRDADTGGQTKYVVDLARALGEREEVAQVDLFTRRIVDPSVSDDYAQQVEPLTGSARIVRIDAGPDEYLPKEQLWDHLDSFLDNLMLWFNEQPRMPDLVHSHYADAGYVGVRLSKLLAIPLVHTGHSLGRDKRKRLLASGLSAADIESTYNIARRIAAEEEVLANAELVITSTHNEIEEQYGLYDYYDPGRMVVIPPGTDMTQFRPARPDESRPFEANLKPFFRNPEKPLILTLCRPDERKNISTLVEAYGESPALQEAANLLIIAGNRDDIRDLNSGARRVLTDLLLLVDAYDLYGKVAIPKHHRPDDVPEIYRLAAASKGVFVNPALIEPFGLTLLEAAACGLPLVATENGGPVDIIANCDNGILIDPLDREAIAAALFELLGNEAAWSKASENGLIGVKEHYTWQAHAGEYLEKLETLLSEQQPLVIRGFMPNATRYRERAIFTDLDQSLLGDAQGLQRFSDLINQHRKATIFGIATGRRLDSALALIKKHAIPSPDILISSLGTRIHYGRHLSEDDHWAHHIDHHWNRDRILKALRDQPGIVLQHKTKQSEFKVSYNYDPAIALTPPEIIALVHQHEITANVIFSFGQYIDVIPTRASKGQALRYVAMRLEIPLDHILAAGGSGADEDMIRGNTLGVIVANRHHEELSKLEEIDRIYFSEQAHAQGILDAMKHYDFLSTADSATAR